MIDSDELLTLARLEANGFGTDPPSDAVLRRAVSTAYYAAFHALLGTIAEMFTTDAPGQWRSRLLFYRALDHVTARNRCKKLGLESLPKEEANFFEIPQFAPELRGFANVFVALQEQRHKADYDPELRLTKELALDAVEDATGAIHDLKSAGIDQRKLFLSYLLFGLRT
jgi:hypothetical protein